MKLYGFWRSLATYRVRTALAYKGVAAPEVSINLLKGAQHARDYKAINPQSVVPALVVDDRPPLFQSLAILEYLEETHPQPPLLPPDPRGRARVRGLALVVACDAHPLIVPRIRDYLEREMHLDEAARNRWLQHWTRLGLETLEAHLAREPETGRFCHGDAPSLADICLCGQVFAGGYFDVNTDTMPAVERIFAECMKIEAFDRSQPLKQPDAPKHAAH
ncbi:MAG TPA: maleylacetoacetate isomerase [Casimicrobiaceae bacterium]|nr:maleylacetoacetate isomerase [Casimicrobiaceae bacterium]